jgi:glycosyltransferase involved in cell wall biosynthesis
MRDALIRRGIDARAFAETVDPSLDGQGLAEAREFLAGGPLVIFHQATRWDAGYRLFQSARGTKLVRDHNVTPPDFFAGLSEDFREAATLGIEQRQALVKDRSVELFLAASQMNADELAEMGADPRRVAVVPPFHRAEELAELAADEPALRRWANAPSVVLFVGRLAPNKGHRLAMRVAAAYRELFGEPLRLRFVGFHDPRWSRWVRVLEAERRALGLESQVEFLGSLSEGELKSAYLTSHLFLCCSEHEGFCVPLVEAARLGVAVVATEQRAVRETLGPNGLLVGRESEDVIAVAVRRVLKDAGLRDRLVAAQAENYAARFSPPRIADQFLALIAPFLGEGALAP